MLRRTLQAATLIFGAIASLPAISHADREWFWDNGQFVPDISHHEMLPDLKPTRHLRGQGEQASAAYIDRADLERRAIQRDRADLRRQQAALEKRGAQLAKLEATLKRQQAKFRQQTPEHALALQQTSITCDAAAAAVADFGFQEVKPELCKGNTLRFDAIRDGKKFSIELAPNGELTKVRRIPEG
jgi:hypothetical protein